MTNALHTLCNLYHYGCFHICKDLMEGENKYEYENMKILAVAIIPGTLILMLFPTRRYREPLTTPETEARNSFR